MKQGELVEELVKVDLLVVSVVVQDVQRFDNVAFDEMQPWVDGVEKKLDLSDVHRPQRVTVHDTQQLQKRHQRQHTLS